MFVMLQLFFASAIILPSWSSEWADADHIRITCGTWWSTRPHHRCLILIIDAGLLFLFVDRRRWHYIFILIIILYDRNVRIYFWTIEWCILFIHPRRLLLFNIDVLEKIIAGRFVITFRETQGSPLILYLKMSSSRPWPIVAFGITAAVSIVIPASSILWNIRHHRDIFPYVWVLLGLQFFPIIHEQILLWHRSWEIIHIWVQILSCWYFLCCFIWRHYLL